MKTISIIDYGIGNIFSISQAIKSVENISINVSRNYSEIMDSDYLILPGVGAFGAAMEKICEYNLDDVIKAFALSGKPILGICLGMQLLADHSTEFGKFSGLGLIHGKVEKIKSNSFKTPVIGWHKLEHTSDHPQLYTSKYQDRFFYFVHSYQFITENENDMVAKYRYFNNEISAIVNHENITGVQFHPEKSGQIGLKFIRDFLNT